VSGGKPHRGTGRRKAGLGLSGNSPGEVVEDLSRQRSDVRNCMMDVQEDRPVEVLREHAFCDHGNRGAVVKRGGGAQGFPSREHALRRGAARLRHVVDTRRKYGAAPLDHATAPFPGPAKRVLFAQTSSSGGRRGAAPPQGRSPTALDRGPSAPSILVSRGTPLKRASR